MSLCQAPGRSRLVSLCEWPPYFHMMCLKVGGLHYDWFLANLFKTLTRAVVCFCYFRLTCCNHHTGWPSFAWWAERTHGASACMSASGQLWWDLTWPDSLGVMMQLVSCIILGYSTCCWLLCHGVVLELVLQCAPLLSILQFASNTSNSCCHDAGREQYVLGYHCKQQGIDMSVQIR